MKKWMWIPAVLLLTLLGDRLFGIGLRNITERSGFRYSRLYAGSAEADIVLIGNSRGLTLYQPILEEATGKSTLNLSYNALSVDLVTALLLDYLDRYRAPERLVVDVTMLDRDNPELVRGFRPYGQFSERLDSLLLLNDPSIYYGAKVAHLSRYGGEVAQRMLYYVGRDDEDWLLDRKMAPQLVKNVPTAEKRIAYTLHRIELLQEVIERYEAAGTQVDLIIAPYYPAYAKTFVNLDSLSLDVLRLTGKSVLDYSQSVSGEVNYGDYQHLNKAGASVFLKRLIQDLKLY